MWKENRVYLFTGHELLLLAATMGIKRMYGFEINPEALEQEEAVYLLHDLSRRGYLQSVEEKFVLSEEMHSIFEHIDMAETVIDVHKASGRSCVVYMGDIAIKISQSMRRNDVFEVMPIQGVEVWNYLLEEGWIKVE